MPLLYVVDVEAIGRSTARPAVAVPRKNRDPQFCPGCLFGRTAALPVERERRIGNGLDYRRVSQVWMRRGAHPVDSPV